MKKMNPTITVLTSTMVLDLTEENEAKNVAEKSAALHSAEVNRLRLMHEAAIAKMEEEVARGRAQYVAAAAAEAATARAKISDALGRATALEAELCAARTESAAASAALAALQSELQQSTQRPVNDSTETKTEISDGASDVDVQSTSAFDSMEASALASRTPDGADELPESGSIRVEEAHVPTSDEGVASRESSSSRASVDRVAVAVAEAEGVLSLLAGLIDDGSDANGQLAPTSPLRRKSSASLDNSNDASRTSPSQSPGTPQQSSPRRMGCDELVSPVLDKALGMKPEEIDHYRGLTLKAWEASDSPTAAAHASPENASSRSEHMSNEISPSMGAHRDRAIKGGNVRRRNGSSVPRQGFLAVSLKLAMAVAVLAAIAAYALGNKSWFRHLDSLGTSRQEGPMDSGALHAVIEPEAVAEVKSMTATTADAEEKVGIDKEANDAVSLRESEQIRPRGDEAEDAVLQCSFEGLAGLYLHTNWPSLVPQAPSHLVSVPLVMALVNSVREAQDRLRPQFTELCGQVHAQNSIKHATSEDYSSSSSCRDIDSELDTFGPEACTEDLLTQLAEWIQRNCQSREDLTDEEIIE